MIIKIKIGNHINIYLLLKKNTTNLNYHTILFNCDIVLIILWQTPYPSGQNAGPTTLVYPQVPQTMNSQPQTRSPVSKQKLVLDNILQLCSVYSRLDFFGQYFESTLDFFPKITVVII